VLLGGIHAAVADPPQNGPIVTVNAGLR